ncbi:MAG: VOC family protein [Rubritepida sp.]|nr:VOC family protein [Rubritepida sp.]
MTPPRYRTDHIHYRTLNAAVSARFWIDVFGATETSRAVVNGHLRVVLDLAGLAVFVEEVPEGTGAPPPAPYLGLEHLALVVDDLDAAVADLTAKGATLARPVSSPRPGVRICFVAAPDGAQVELLERTGG